MILIGADPEQFVRNRATLQFESAHTLIPGTKDQPHRVHLGAVQRDGVAAEFNTDPAHSREEFLVNIRTVQRTLEEMIGPGYDLIAVPTAYFDPVYFKALPTLPKELGCTPDFNAYTRQTNKPPKTKECFRTGAGHIHLGWDNFLDIDNPDHYYRCCALVKQLDAVLFFASLLWDSDEKRRTLYGNIGAFRPKTYGLEYRPMSNAWLNDDDLVLWVYDAAQKATHLFFEQKYIFEKLATTQMIEDYHNKILEPVDIQYYMRRLWDDYDIPRLPEKYR